MSLSIPSIRPGLDIVNSRSSTVIASNRVKLLPRLVSPLTRFLDRILMEHVYEMCSEESTLQVSLICPIEIRSETQDKRLNLKIKVNWVRHRVANRTVITAIRIQMFKRVASEQYHRGSQRQLQQWPTRVMIVSILNCYFPTLSLHFFYCVF